MTDHEIYLYLGDALELADLPDFTRVFFGLDHEDLGGTGRGAKVRELVLWCRRHGRLELLNSLAITIQFFSIRFNLEEIRTLAFDLGIDLDALAGGTKKSSQVVKIMVALHVQHRYQELLYWLRRKRPDMTFHQIGMLP